MGDVQGQDGERRGEEGGGPGEAKEDNGEGEVKAEDKWHEELRGESNYDKLMDLNAQCLKESRQGKR